MLLQYITPDLNDLLSGLVCMELNMIVYKVIIRKLEKKFFNNMCNVFTMELNLIVYTVTRRQLKNKTFDNIYNLFIMEFNIFVRNVLIRQLGNKASTTCVICSQWS